MDILVDASVLIRFVAPDDPRHSIVAKSVFELLEAGHQLYYTPQIARETWSVLTRPSSQNGYGLSPESAVEPLEDVRRMFTFIDDVPGIFEIWVRLVKESKVSGKQVHDANHVAAMLAHGIEEILTLDERDFRRYSDIRIRKPI